MINTILCRTRTGKKVHLASPGSSVTCCGHWLKVSSVAMRFPKGRVLKALEAGHGIIDNPSNLGPANLVLCANCLVPENHRPDWVERFVYDDEVSAKEMA